VEEIFSLVKTPIITISVEAKNSKMTSRPLKELRLITKSIWNKNALTKLMMRLVQIKTRFRSAKKYLGTSFAFGSSAFERELVQVGEPLCLS
jgi:hypothetical protein